MSILNSLLGGLVDKEKATHDTIKAALEDVAEELGCDHKSFFVMIQPTTEKFDFKCWIYRIGENAPECVREITVKEIVKTQNPEDGG